MDITHRNYGKLRPSEHLLWYIHYSEVSNSALTFKIPSTKLSLSMLHMSYASPAWEFAADTHLIKLQPLQNKVLCNIGNSSRTTLVRDLHMAFKFPYI
jgi:hypothetical protein